MDAEVSGLHCQTGQTGLWRNQADLFQRGVLLLRLLPAEVLVGRLLGVDLREPHLVEELEVLQGAQTRPSA